MTAPPPARASLVLLVHLFAAAFGLLGGFLVRWNAAWAWVHGPVALWFVLVNLADWTCPLTTLEQRLRERPGEGGLAGGFFEHYLGRWAGAVWTLRGLERAVGLVFLACNVLVYAWVLR